MAQLYRWIGGGLGLMLGGPLGALAGYALGRLIDRMEDSPAQGQQWTGASQGWDGAAQQGGGWQGADSGHAYDDPYGRQRDTFRFSLLVLASYIIRADGRVMHSEMQLVRGWLRQNFGPEAVADGEAVLDQLFAKQRELGQAEYRSAVMSSCRQLAGIMSYEQRLQLLNFLVMIARADGQVVTAEVSALRECGAAMGVTAADVESMLALDSGGSSLEAAYRVLGVAPEASDAEVRAAYRAMALKNHPDRVASLGEDVRRAAEKKLQEINAAKETIWRARGM